MVGALLRVVRNLRGYGRDRAVPHHIEHADIARHRIDERFRVVRIVERDRRHLRHRSQVGRRGRPPQPFQRIGSEMNRAIFVRKQLHCSGLNPDALTAGAHRALSASRKAARPSGVEVTGTMFSFSTFSLVAGSDKPIDNDLVQPLDRFSRRLGWCVDRVPSLTFCFYAGLLHRRDVWQKGRPRIARCREHPGLAAAMQFQRVAERNHGDRNLPAEQVGHDRAGTAIADMLEVQPGVGRDHDREEMTEAASAGRTVIGLRGIGLRPGDQFLDGLDVVLRRDRERDVEGGDQRDRREIADRIVFEGWIGVWIDRNRRVRHKQQRRAVRFSCHDRLDADASGRTRAVFDDHRHRQARTEFLGHNTGHGVSATSRGEWINQANRVLRLGPRIEADCRTHRGCTSGEKQSTIQSFRRHGGSSGAAFSPTVTPTVRSQSGLHRSRQKA